MADQRVGESIASLERKIAQGSGDREMVFELAGAYRESNRSESAANLLADYLFKTGPDWEACRFCVEAYHEAGRMEDAVRILNRWASLYRDRAQFWILRGLILEEMGDWQSAYHEHCLAGGIAPHMAEAHYRQGVTLMHLNQNDKALEAFGITLRLKPRLVPALINVGLIHEMEQRIPEAIETFERAISIEPASADAHLNLGALYGELGQSDAAVDHFKQALELDEMSSEAAYNLGLALMESEGDQAIIYFRRALTLDPDNLDAYHNLGAVAQKQGKWNVAVEMFRQVLLRDPDRLNTLSAMGACHSKADRPEMAIATFNELLSKDPSNAEAWFYLALSYDKKGESAAAQKAYKQADHYGGQAHRRDD